MVTQAELEGMLSVYDRIGKQRSLEPHELDRAIALAKHLKALKSKCRRDRENKEKKAKALKEYRATERGKKNYQASAKRSYLKHHEARKKRAREWRLRNPEAYAAKLAAQRKKDKPRGADIRSTAQTDQTSGAAREPS